MLDFIKEHKKVSIAVGVVLVLIIFIRGGISARNEKLKQEEADALTQQLLEEANQGVTDEEDSLLMQMQPELVKSFGKVPDGFIWESDGTLLSLGDKSMSAEEVVYSYFRGLASLDISTVERYSRDSKVVESYSTYFDSKNKNTDYMDQFLRNMYKECLLSLQIQGIDSNAVFAANKQVFTVNAKMLDLTNKDFWKKDEMEIYKNLYLYDQDESDTTKSDMYLYSYILDYYESDEALLRDVTFDITVEKYPDLDSGWLVSIDNDVDDACSYKDGKLVVSYIKELYRNVGRDAVMENMSISN